MAKTAFGGAGTERPKFSPDWIEPAVALRALDNRCRGTLMLGRVQPPTKHPLWRINIRIRWISQL